MKIIRSRFTITDGNKGHKKRIADKMKEEAFVEYKLDFTGIDTREKLHDYLAEVLPLPDYYGRNLDALYDSLMEMPLCMISLYHIEALEVLGEYALLLSEVFEAASTENLRLMIIYVTDESETNSVKQDESKGKFDGKRILIWGYGREGKSTEQFLKDNCKPSCVDIFEGKREEIDEDKYDYIIKSPGIPMDEDNDKYTSQTDIFLEAYRDQVIGITGTKGKSTTSAMMAHVLSECLDRKVIFLGNIGEPCLNYYNEIDKDTIVVFEMSCHQLAHAHVSPHIAVMLNLYEEHLDYYKTAGKYYDAKCNITKYQVEGDHFYVGDQVLSVKDVKANDGVSVHVINREDTPEYELKVLGDHNRYNAYVVSTIASEQFKIPDIISKDSLKDFEGLAHRLQFIGTVDGIDYYDDSISTIPGATISALEAVKNAYSVIIGGMDRGIDYSLLIDYVKAHPEYCYIFAYESGKRIFDDVNAGHYVEDLEAAVKLAKELTPKGKACILSPAAASYGYFKNFEHRGEVFKELVYCD